MEVDQTIAADIISKMIFSDFEEIEPECFEVRKIRTWLDRFSRGEVDAQMLLNNIVEIVRWTG